MYELWFWMILPVVVVAVVVLIVICSTIVKRCRPGAASPAAGKAKLGKSKRAAEDGASPPKREETHGGAQTATLADDRAAPSAPMREASIFEKTLPPVLQIMFVLYPLVTTAAFEGFPCYEFEGGRGWLIADVSIECRTPDHANVTMWAWIAVFVYPIGILATSALLLLRASKAIISGVETPLSRACYFLYKEYDPTCFWWELMEMGRKFLLVGLFVNVQPGSITQITIGTIVCAVYLMIQLQAKPYRLATDD